MSLSRENSNIPLVAGAAEASSVEAAEAIHEAAAENADPQVAQILDHAAIAADQTVSRVGWLRGVFDRLFSRPA
jgi:hypothetical protein